MEFAETYRYEVIQSRRDRSRRALFWSRILGIVLMLTIAGVLRSEPDLRRALSTAGSDAILAIAGRNGAPTPAPMALPKGTDDQTVHVSTRPRDRIKVNRPTQSERTLGPQTGGSPTMPPDFANNVDPEALSNMVQQQLKQMRPRP
tara:strand:+ start:747 stop:1184 length:438 start_codon:yes stop_codon:yes gene_type:complete